MLNRLASALLSTSFLLLAACGGTSVNPPPSDLSTENTSQATPTISQQQPSPSPNSTIEAESSDLIQLIGKGRLEDMAISPDGSILALAGSTGVWLYDLPAQAFISYTPIANEWVEQLDWLASGKSLLAVTESDHLYQIQTGSGDLTQVHHPEGRVRHLSTSPTAELAAIIIDPHYGQEQEAKPALYLWEPQADTYNLILSAEDSPTEEEFQFGPMTWSSAGDLLALDNGNSNISILEVRGGDIHHQELPYTTDLPLQGIHDLSFSPDGNQLAFTFTEGTPSAPGGKRNIATEFHILDLGDNQLIHQSEVALDSPIAWSERGLLAHADTSFINITAASGDEPLKQIAYTGHIRDLQWAKSGSTLLVEFWDPVAFIWHKDEGLTTLEFSDFNKTHNASGGWSADGSLYAHVNEDQLDLLDVANDFTPVAGTGPAKSTTWSPVANKLAIITPDSEVLIWHLDQVDQPLKKLPVDYQKVSLLDWSPDGRQLVLVHEIWDFFGGGAMLESTGISVLDSASGAELATLDPTPLFDEYEDMRQVTSLRWAPHGELIAAGHSTGNVIVWEANDGEHLYTYQDHGYMVPAVDWSPDGSELLSGSYDFNLIRWNVSTGEVLQRFRELPSNIRAVRYSPDGSRFAASIGSEVRVWQRGEESALWSSNAHTGDIIQLDWSPDGNSLSTTSQDGTTRIWSLEE